MKKSCCSLSLWEGSSSLLISGGISGGISIVWDELWTVQLHTTSTEVVVHIPKATLRGLGASRCILTPLLVLNTQVLRRTWMFGVFIAASSTDTDITSYLAQGIRAWRRHSRRYWRRGCSKWHTRGLGWWKPHWRRRISWKLKGTVGHCRHLKIAYLCSWWWRISWKLKTTRRHLNVAYLCHWCCRRCLQIDWELTGSWIFKTVCHDGVCNDIFSRHLCFSLPGTLISFSPSSFGHCWVSKFGQVGSLLCLL